MQSWKNQGEAGGIEHAGFGVDGFTEVLGADERVVTSLFGNDTVDMKTVGGDEAADIFGGVEEDTLDAIGCLGLQGKGALTLEEGIGGPGGAPEDTGGIGGGGHGVEVLLKLELVDFLGFVDREEEIGSGTDNPGGGITGEKLEAGFTEVVHESLG